MKTIIKNIAWPMACLALIISLSSFKFQNKKISAKANYGMSEYSQVREFVYKNICTPLMNADERDIKMRSFSRCPSGYQSRMITSTDSVKVDRDVYGTIVLYQGCSPAYVCDFKVNVSKNVILVKSKETQEYISVAEWLEKKQNKKPEPEIKNEQPKEVKG